jgi:Flp pilus assembly protein TadD
MAKFATAETDDKCAICLESFVDPYALDCGHTFCRGCINTYKERGVNDVCPYCRAPLPPGAAQSVDECHKIAARMIRYEATGDTKRMAISQNLQLHHAQRAVKADPKHSPARFYLALGLEKVNKDVDSAEREYREAIRLAPNHASAHANLGVLLSARKDHAGAEREYRKAIRCDPNEAGAHSNLGSLLDEVRKDYDGAEREYREAIRCDPNYTKAHTNLGSLLDNVRKDYAGAEREFRVAIRCNPNSALARRNLGCVMMKASGDRDGAEREFRAAVRIDPNDAKARSFLQRVLAQKADANTQVKSARVPPAIELRVGNGVVLAGLSSAKFNGARGTIVSGCKDGRWGVKLHAHGGGAMRAMAIKTENIRIHGAN